MIMIGKNTKSDLKLVFTQSGKIRHVPKDIAHLDEGSILESMNLPNGEVIENFNFTATIRPKRWVSTRAGASIYFEDVNDPFVYRMTQKGLFQLLTLLCDKSENVGLVSGGISGLFTFSGSGNILTINVYGG